MTNLQLLLTIGIPSLLVILSWVNSNQRMSRLEASFDALRVEMRAEMNALRKEVNDKLTEIQVAVARADAKAELALKR